MKVFLIGIFTTGQLAITALGAFGQVTPPAAYPSGTKVSYIRTWDVQAPEGLSHNVLTRPNKDAKMTTQYVDGIGRPLQTVARQASQATGSAATDFVTANVYDDLGQERYQYLPFAANNTGGNTSITDGRFKSNPFQQQASFMQSQFGSQGETYFYSQTNFETSPLNRVIKSLPPGNNWVGGNRGTSKEYGLNDVAETALRVWTIGLTSGSIPVSAGIYNTGELQRNATYDEHNNLSFEYIDKAGRTVLKSQQNGSEWMLTYYIYDELGNLRCVISPQAVPQISTNWIISQQVMDELCFRYEYDHRNRMIMKKVPGAGEMYMFYDPWDRVVLTQDANQRANNQYSFTKYDVMNRPVVTGIYSYWGTTQDARNLAQNYAPYRFEERASGGNGSGYTSRCWPEGNYELLTATYYDDYDWLASQGNPFSPNRYTGNDWAFLAPSTTQFPYPESMTQSFAVRGLVTGTSTRVLGTGQFLTSINYYDDKGRVLQTRRHNVSSCGEVISYQYSFSGQILVQNDEISMCGSPNQYHWITTKYEYDDQWRVLTLKKQANNGAVASGDVSIAENKYDALGQLKEKKLAPGFNNNAGLEILAFEYNIRGWLLGMNRAYARDAVNTNYFGFDLGYDKTNNNLINNQAYTTAQYSGNIAGMVWKSKGDEQKRKYDFTYDALNRLLKADFTQYTGGAFNLSAGVDYTVGGNPATGGKIKYDLNGNILEMWQKGFKLINSDWVDKMKYNYYSNSNKLQNVVDAQNNPQTKLGDFRSSPVYMAALGGAKTDAATDYTYDANGNLKRDRNKDIGDGTYEGIIYNHLNLPTNIVVRTTGGAIKGMITYTYDAAGNKLKKLTEELNASITHLGVTYSTSIYTTTTYLGGVVYETKTYSHAALGTLAYTNKLQFISHEEGRIRFTPAANPAPARFDFDYMVKDHLGNVRVLLTTEQREIPYIPATVEDNSWTTEDDVYNISDNRRVDKSLTGATQASFQNKLYRTQGNNAGENTGLGIVLKVMATDKVRITAESFYTMPGGGGAIPYTAMPLTDLLSAFTNSGLITSKGTLTPTDVNNIGSNATNLSGILNRPPANSNMANAYLNYIFFDENLNYVSAGADPVNANGGYRLHDYFINVPAIATKNGYLYVFVNSQNNFPVYFDNLTVTHIPGAILEETHYYPFGLRMTGISNNTLAFGDPKNTKGYAGNEIQNKEFSDGSGLDLYDFNARTYDQQIGRFIQIDPLGEEMDQESWSLYHYGYNNPIIFSDPDGKFPIPIIIGLIELGKLAVSGYAAYKTTEYIVNNAPELPEISLNLPRAGTGSGIAPSVPMGGGPAMSEFAVERQLAKANKEVARGKSTPKIGGTVETGGLSNAAAALKGSNNSKTRAAAKTGQEAHRQEQKKLKEEDPGATTEVNVLLKDKTRVRKDGQKSDGTYVIIKPDTKTGQKAAEKRQELLNKNGLPSEIRYYDPENPAYQPGSPTYIGPQTRPKF